VERTKLDRRKLTKYLAVLLEVGTSCCFYCEKAVSSADAHIDHVIPWSFLFEDPLWDLVAACAQCNSGKSDWLPERRFIDRLVLRNLHRNFSALPPDEIANNVERYYEAAISVEWPGFWGPRPEQRNRAAIL